MGQEYKQIKSLPYYIFWGTATLAVVIGQMAMVGSYRRLSKTIDSASWRVVIDSCSRNNSLRPVPAPSYEAPFYVEPPESGPPVPELWK